MDSRLFLALSLYLVATSVGAYCICRSSRRAQQALSTQVHTVVSRRAAAAHRTLGGQPRLAQSQAAATKCSMVPAKLTLCSHLA